MAAALLLTLPGFPFVYYGEEIGMIGNKPDPRIRTPMHWSRERTAGFSRALPWEPLTPDSLTANVAVEEGDSTSLLQLYRRMIHLRSTVPALAAGELVPLRSTSDAIAAYVRRDSVGPVLVVANLGTSPLSDVRLSSDVVVAKGGRYRLRPLVGEAASAATLVISPAGRIEAFAPQVLAPMTIQVFELVGIR
jgi:glycosidase